MLPREQNGKILLEIQNCLGKDDDDYIDILAWALGKLGVMFFSYVYVRGCLSSVDEPIIFGSYPEGWVFTYQSNHLYRKDPVIKRSCITSSPFTWDEKIDDDAREPSIFALSEKYGIGQGFTVPIHEPGRAFGSMHFAADASNKDFIEMVLSNWNLLASLSFLAHQHRPEKAQQRFCNSLTDRESEFLYWVALGKTYSEIAVILDISERTVKYHAKNVMEKLDSVNIKQAMMKALKLGWV